MTLTRLLVATLAVSLAAGLALAKSSFKTRIPNGTVYECSTCHIKPSAPATWNDFGLDVKANLSGGTPDWAAVCEMDSDGDGWTNGEELLDPDCVWSTGDPMPGLMGDVTKPGDPNSAPPEPEPDVTFPMDVSPDHDGGEFGPEDTEEFVPSEPVCTSDSDCGEGYECVWIDSVTSDCEVIACASDDDCPGGFMCLFDEDGFGECEPEGMPSDLPGDPAIDSDDPTNGGSAGTGGDGGGCGAGGGPQAPGLALVSLLGLAAVLRRRTVRG